MNKYGKSEVTIDTYIRYICINSERAGKLNHNLAFAELMSRLAPEKARDEWYIAGLLNDITEMHIPGTGEHAGIMKALLAKAHINPGVINAIDSYKRASDPKRWNPLITALNFAETHIEDSCYITTAECCMKRKGRKRCNACMYARYIFAQHGYDEKAEDVIRGLKEELGKRDREERREERDGVCKQGRMEERSEKTNAFAAG